MRRLSDALGQITVINALEQIKKYKIDWSNEYGNKYSTKIIRHGAE